MIKLPHWVLNNKYPAVFDSESATVIEQTARVYGAMQQLIDDYNNFVDQVNLEIDNFTAESNQSAECFKEMIVELCETYINSIDLKMDEATAYMKTNLEQTADRLLQDIIVDLRNDMADFEEMRTDFRSEFNSFLTESNARLDAQDDQIEGQNSVLNLALSNMNTTLTTQNATIAEAVEYMQTNLESTVSSAVATLIENETIVMGVSVDPVTESMTFTARNTTEPTDLYLGYDEVTETITITEVNE